ncbi:hypothetical protein KFE25_013891 [Diacronema lutheri]|uniref:Uncharacterized protein n=1 Tax=Diacronema lutheri TaxID=2081491 RepID=A0A8J6C4N3_DIALT|nr:hypothetical protein KFE25_013891 [Diacronema lutheri]
MVETPPASLPPTPPDDKVKEMVKKAAKGAFEINLKEYSRLTGYAWGAFVGAAGLAFLMAQVLGAGKPANPAVRASGEAGGRPEAGGASAAT